MFFDVGKIEKVYAKIVSKASNGFDECGKESEFMTARIIDGKKIASTIRSEVRAEVAGLKAKGIVPGLSVILVGDDPLSLIHI